VQYEKCSFAIDVLACPRCGGRLRLIATLHDPAVIRRMEGAAPTAPAPGDSRIFPGFLA